MIRANQSRRLIRTLFVAPALVVLLSGPVAASTSDPNPEGPRLDITWGQIVARASCMLSSWLDMGWTSITGPSFCAIHIRIDDVAD